MSDCTRIYIDGVFDLFHRGHIEALKKARSVRSNVYLIAGLISDEEATSYKRKPIYNEDDRFQIVSSLSLVDQVIFPAPLIVTKAFLEKYKIDLVVHGFSDLKDLEKQKAFFKDIEDTFEIIPYFPYLSTSKYISDISSSTKNTSAGAIQSYHGGQDIYKIKDLKVDLSVTTNGIGPVKTFFENNLSQERFQNLADHYPPMNDYQLTKDFLNFIYKDMEIKSPPRVIFGNGATELIDLVISNLKHVSNWKTNQVDTQYREYFNACQKQGYEQLDSNTKDTDLTIIVNPNNPTGDFLHWEKMLIYVDTLIRDNSLLVVDESMLFWYSKDWIKHSFLGHLDYVRWLKRKRHIDVVVIQSWTKIYSCTGLRIGSVVFFSDIFADYIEHKKTPWSLNSIARDYLMHAWKQDEYLLETWEKTMKWRGRIVGRIQSRCPQWRIYGEPWQSWIWIDTHNEAIASGIVKKSYEVGFPIRDGAKGYNRPTCIRVGVRDPDKLEVWFNSLPNHQTTDKELGTINNVSEGIVLCTKTISIYDVLVHENYVEESVKALQNYLQITENFLIPTIIVSEIKTDSKKTKYLLIDGHHRLEVFTRLDYNKVVVTVIDYDHPSVMTHLDSKKSIPKEAVIDAGWGSRLPPKSTRHVVAIGNETYLPISILSSNVTAVLT